MDADYDLSIEHVIVGRTGKVALVVRAGGRAAKVFKTDVLDEASREKAQAEIEKHFPALKETGRSNELAAKLLEIADDVAQGLVGQPSGLPTTGEEGSVSDDRSPEELVAEMPDDIRAEAAAMLADPELIRRIVLDIAAMGVAGEHALTMTIYVIGTSRLLDEPLAGIVQGPSSSGKSFPIGIVSRLMPRESVIRATHMSPQALYYMEHGSLAHKFIVAGERSPGIDEKAAETTCALRQMLSEGQLDKVVTITADRKPKTVRIHQDGPIAYVESTTVSVSRIFPEDANRCIILQTDERPAQTRRVFRAVAARYSRDGPHIDTDRIIQRHWAMQRMLTPKAVAIPYASRLAKTLPHDRVEGRRAIGHLMNMVAAITLLHQRQRIADSQGRLVATADDYRIARRLLDKPMSRLLGRTITDAARRCHGRLSQWFGSDEFSTHEATQKENYSDRSVRGWLSELYHAGYIDLVQPSRGPNAAVWRLAVEPSIEEPTAALPSVEQICSDSRCQLSGNPQLIETAEVTSEMGGFAD